MKIGFARWLWLIVFVTLPLGAQGAAAQPPIGALPPNWAEPPWLAPALAPNAVPLAPAGYQDIALPDHCLPTVFVATNHTAYPISDPPASNSVVTATVTITQNVPYTFAIYAATSISHTHPGDLVIDLISPDGTDVTLSNRRGGGYTDVFTLTDWLDVAGLPSEPVTEADFSIPAYPRYLIPEEALGAFQGKNVAGDWKLVVADRAAGDTGTLNLFALVVVGMSRPAMTTIHYSQNIPSILSDTVNLYSPLVVNGPNDRIISARLTTNITHPKPRQLSIELGAPVPVTTTISNHNGSFFTTNFANWFAGTVWDDKAGDLYPPGAVTMDQAVYPTSPLTATVPEGAMSHFVGLQPNGVWKLHITDNTLGAGGTLNSWGLDLTTAHCLPLYLPLVNRN